MERFVRIYDRILNVITNITGVVAGLLVLFTGFMIVYEVICRSIFNTPTEWVMEISTYCVVVAGFLGMGVAYAGKKHIHVDILISRLSPKARCYIEFGTAFIGAFYSLIFMQQSWEMAMFSLEINNCAPTTLSTPLWIPQISMPIGLLVLLLQIIRTILVDFIKIKNNDFSEEAK